MTSAVGCATKNKAIPVFTDPQQIIQISPGQQFQIRLPADRAGGLEWKTPYINQGEHLVLIGQQYPSGMGEQTWTFQAVRSGDTSIPMEYVRVFERNLPIDKAATFKVSIH
ncbi:MAG: protease inhibitor I42 family protein [Bacillota bacterium]